MKIYDYKGKKNLTGYNIKRIRTQQRVSQTELAQMLQDEGISIERDSISRMEAGRRVVLDYELITIAKVLKVSIQELIS